MSWVRSYQQHLFFNLPTLGEKKNNTANTTKKDSSENLHSKPREGVDEVSLLLRSVEITS